MRTLTYDADLELKDVGDTGSFKGVASIFNKLDSYRDSILPGAFAKSIDKKGPEGIRMLWQHDSDWPIGTWSMLKETKKKLLVDGDLVTDSFMGNEAHVLLKAGAVKGISIGFSIPKGKHRFDPTKNIRFIEEIDLWENSLVTFPAMDGAQVTSVKSVLAFQALPSAPASYRWNPQAAKARIEEWANGNEEDYSHAFLWSEDGDFEFQIADVIDDQLMIVPKAIISAATVIEADWTDVELDEDEVVALKHHIEQYATDLGIEVPWRSDNYLKSLMCGLAVTINTPREFETFLRDAGWSRKEATSMALRGFAGHDQGDPDEGSALAAALDRASVALLTK